MQEHSAEPRKETTSATAPNPGRFRTFAGTIDQGMEVISADGDHLGNVERVEGDHIVLVPSSDDADKKYFVPLSLIDGIDRNQVLLADRGDGVFGLGAAP